ncbi:MAG: Fic family protein [Polyangiaceae bacterium]|nr:Fic family protein [Polyangiaceae bacterium]
MPARTKKKPNKSAKKARPAPKKKARAAAKARRAPARPAKRPKPKAKPKATPKARPKARPKAKAKPIQRAKTKAASPAALKRQREQERARAQKERERAQKERERERERAQKERERAQKERDKARAREAKAREAEREAERKAKEAERERLKEAARKAKEAERLAREAERERVREEARKAKEAERAARDAEREAYRKAKEAERERLRAEREAARRALEGRVARASKRALRAGAKASTTRVYRPDAIPNQAGTTRRTDLAPLPRPVVQRAAPPPPPPPPPPPSPPPPPASIEERYALVVKRLSECDSAFQNEYAESLEMSWVYHDSALEGVVYTYQELRTAIDPGVNVVADSSMQPVVDEIRRHRQTLALVRDLGEKKRAPITVDTVKKIYLTLHPEEGDLKNLRYRKDIPQHRLYFHEYAPPDKIAYKVRQVIDWLNGPEPKKIKHAIRIAARVHYDLVRVFPFSNDSGKVARMLMNIILLRAGHPPAIIHSTERQRYYEALKSSLPTLIQMITESITNGLASIEKRLDERDSRLRSFTA